MVLMPPGSAKSTYVSTLFPPWYLSRRPDHALIAASHTAELAERFGRRVRNTINEYAPTLGITLSPDIQAANQWETKQGGEYFAVGVLGSVTGRRADVCIVDDPVRSRAEADSETVRERVWEWWKADLSTRLKPGAKIVLVMCMTGDTRVLMADGREVQLRHVRPGDEVATYAKGQLGSSKVISWKSQGYDDIYEVRMKSGGTLKANQRHPFLVVSEGGIEWKRLQNLRLGESLVRVRADDGLRASGANGSDNSVYTQAAKKQLSLGGFARLTTINTDGQRGLGPHQILSLSEEGLGSKIATALRTTNISKLWRNKAVSAPFADWTHSPEALSTGGISFASTTIIRQGESEDCFATIATSRSENPTLQKSWKQQRDTSDFIADEIVEIVGIGRAEVFDVEIAQTENFIANGYVSHNTRWHEDDLGGRLLQEMATGGRQWEVLKLPMEAENNDPLGRRPGEPLWPEWFTQDMRDDAKRDQRTWSALYQQSPAPDTGIYFERDWLRPANSLPRLVDMKIYGASDYAVTADGGDWTVHVVMGLDPDWRLWLLDLWRGQTASDEWIDAFCDMVIQWKPLAWAEEQGQIKAGIGPFLNRRQRERQAYVARRAFPTRGDKAIRAQSIRGRMALDGLHYLASAPWRADFEAELMAFPAGKFDDQVDSIGLCGQLLDVMVPGTVAPDPAQPMRGIADMTMNEVWEHTRRGRRGKEERL